MDDDELLILLKKELGSRESAINERKRRSRSSLKAFLTSCFRGFAYTLGLTVGTIVNIILNLIDRR